LDTNIIVSAYLNEDGLPFFIMKLALAKVVQMCASEPVLAEYEELLQRKSYRLDRRRGKLLLDKLRAASTMVKPAGHLSETSDPGRQYLFGVRPGRQGGLPHHGQHQPFSPPLEVYRGDHASHVHQYLERPLRHFWPKRINLPTKKRRP